MAALSTTASAASSGDATLSTVSRPTRCSWTSSALRIGFNNAATRLGSARLDEGRRHARRLQLLLGDRHDLALGSGGEPNALGLRLAFHFVLDDDLTFGRADRVGHHRLRLGLGLRLRSRLSLESSLPLDDRRVLEARRSLDQRCSLDDRCSLEHRLALDGGLDRDGRLFKLGLGGSGNVEALDGEGPRHLGDRRGRALLGRRRHVGLERRRKVLDAAHVDDGRGQREGVAG